ncbi:MAG: hypothetical protein K8F25_06230 [Fimbriimonadaceae bacterium]|nr:hypothetical protein [Alphaproteobacteria bacterium]
MYVLLDPGIHFDVIDAMPAALIRVAGHLCIRQDKDGTQVRGFPHQDGDLKQFSPRRGMPRQQQDCLFRIQLFAGHPE